MQLTTYLSAAAAMVTSVSATYEATAVDLNKSCDKAQPLARIVNRCDYDVHLWSVFKGEGCPTSGMVTLKTGEVYNENYRNHTDGVTGVSIKVSKTQQCKGNDIVQLEYFRKLDGPKEFQFNYLDVSYVDCLDNDCPTKAEGFYFVAGDQKGAQKASAANTWCPVMACHDAASCAKMAYILPDDVQTKTCDLNASIDYYMCGGEEPTEDYNSAPVVAAPSSKQPEYSAVLPTALPTQVNDYKVEAAAVTPAPEAQYDGPKRIKTEVVTVTAYEYVNEKRHAHGHARRHQQFHG